MSDSVETQLGNDVEAQHSLLEKSAGSAVDTTTRLNAIKTFRKVVWSILSAERLKLAVARTISSSSDSGTEDDDNGGGDNHNLRQDESNDVEAQQEALLPERPTGSAEAANFNARKAFRRAALYIRSAQLFKLGVKPAAHIEAPLISSPSYIAIAIADDEPTQDQDSITAAAAASSDTLEGSNPETSNAHSASDNRKRVTEILREKDLQALSDFGGVERVAEALNSDLEKGISSPQRAPQHKSIQPCGLNVVTIFHSLVAACNNYPIFLLFIAASFHLGFGIKKDGWRLGWLTGVIVAGIIFVIVFFTTIMNCLEEWSNKRLENSWRLNGVDMRVQVVRDGHLQHVSESDLDVGDIAILGKEDYVPADGLFVNGQSLEVVDGLSESTTVGEGYPFLFYGSRVISARTDARMLVVSTRMDTVWGETMSDARQNSAESESKFEPWLDRLNTYVCIFGTIQSILIIIVLFLRYKFGMLDKERGDRSDSKGKPTEVKTITDAIKGAMMASSGTARVLTTILSLSMLGVTEGMAFVPSVATIFWSSMILVHKALARDHLACLKMGSVTIVCIDKFGGVIEDAAEIGKFYVGEGFVSENSVKANVLEGLCDGIGSLYLQGLDEDCRSNLLPLTSWAETRSGVNKESMVEQCKVMRTPSGHNPFKGRCDVVIEKNGQERLHMHCRGPLKDILPSCHRYFGINGEELELDERKKRKLNQDNSHMKDNEAKVVAFACKRVGSLDEASAESSDFIFVGMISVKETKMEDIKRDISTLSRGGIRTIILSSGNDVEEPKAIVEECGVLSPNDLVRRAEEFRGKSNEEKMNMVENIRILGSCLPSDKIDVIKCLRTKGHVVALLGQRMMDAPALKQADIGLTYGTWCSAVSRDSCDIVIWEDNCFSFLVDAIQKGRCYQEKIRKLIQLQLIFTVSSWLINLTAVAASGDAPITAVEFFWLNVVVPLCGGLALLTGPSTKEQMTMLTFNSIKKLMTKSMWRNIAIQACYQTTVFLVLNQKGQAILRLGADQLNSMIYNGFFMCQVFGTFIAREPEKMNIFTGLTHKNKWFWIGSILLLICQAVFAGADQVLGSGSGLNWKIGGACLLIGLGSWLVDLAGKMVWDFAASYAAGESGI